MKFKSLISLLLAVMMFLTAATGTLVSVSAEDATDSAVAATETETPAEDENSNPYSVAAQALDAEYAYDGDDLGCTYTPSATSFKVWAPTATEIAVNLFATGSDDENGAADLGTYKMSYDEETGCWSTSIVGDLKNVYYTYTVTNTALVTGEENTAEVVDPYAKAVGVNGDRAMVVDLDSTDPEGWDEDAHVYVDQQTDAVVWEIVVRDFSASETSGVSEANRGKFLAFTESGTTVNGEGFVPTCVDYLKELGITHVQINPFYDFSTVNEAKDLSDQYNWGYDPKNYNVPEGSYSSNPYDGNVRINECKQMIKALHDAGIGVIMDVVYNHTYLTTTSNFQLLVPNYYYRINEMGGWSSASGCGNDTASERAMYRKFMLESCRYWVEEYHVDGFRFDLMGIHDAETMNLIREDLDSIDPRIIMYGEGWSAASSAFDETTCTGAKTVSASQFYAEHLSERIALFNDEIRDGIKGHVFTTDAPGFAQGAKIYSSNIAYGIRANTVGKGSRWSASAPSQCVTYSCCHDNHTLYDRLVASVCGPDGNYRQRYSDLIEMNKLSAGIVTTSQGICFLLAGEEMGRSKDGDTNSYKSPVELNMIDWSGALTNADLVSYYRGLIAIRKAFAPFNEGTKKYASAYKLNGSLTSVQTCVAYTVENDVEGEWEKVAVIYNSDNKETQQVTLSDNSVDEWVVIADNTTAGFGAIKEVKGNTFEVAPSSCLIAVDKESFYAVGLESDDSKVIVNHKNIETGEILSTQVITGQVGNGYKTVADGSLALEYDLVRVEGDAEGTIASEDAYVTYLYELYKAPSLKEGDINGDGLVNIKDATAIQKHCASLITFTEEQLKKADYDYNENVNIKDSTMLQKHLVGLSVSIGSVTTNFCFEKEDGTVITLAPSVTKKFRVGTEYTTSATTVELYTVKETLPENATGIVKTGVTNVYYYYDYTGSGIKIHAAHLDETADWVPFLWAWNDDGNAYSAWPGVAMVADGDGWYSIDAALSESDSYSVIISNKGSPQSANYTDITASEIWIVIDDSKVINQGKFLTIYDEKPDLDALRAATPTE